MQKQVIRRSESLVPVEVIQNKIYWIRGHKVMLDKDLAELYGVLTKNLNKAVRRNLERFPEDFTFTLTKEEFQNLRFQFGTSSWGGERYLPFVFTEQGVAMLSSVLNSERAVQVNIQIIRVFTKLREMMISHKDLARKIGDLERKFQGKFQEHDKKFILVFEAIKQLLKERPTLAVGGEKSSDYKRTKIGFIVDP
ncbi:MAG: ORF6N domain-containing protein [Candidatus Omnitrophica bacterium]|nr:ORF6N domain-containing protein [Candidatus Omnitrophota bacterium]